MNFLDIFILVSVAGGVVHGITTGLIKQVASIFGLILAFIVAVQGMHTVGGMIVASLGLSEEIAPLVGFVLLFLLIQLLVFAIAKMVEALVGALKLTWANRILGGGIGAFKAALVLSVLFLVLRYVEIPSQTMSDESMFYGIVSEVLPEAWDFVSEHVPEVEKLSDRFSMPLQEEVPLNEDGP